MEGENPSVVKQWSKSGQTSANRVESGGGGGLRQVLVGGEADAQACRRAADRCRPPPLPSLSPSCSIFFLSSLAGRSRSPLSPLSLSFSVPLPSSSLPRTPSFLSPPLSLLLRSPSPPLSSSRSAADGCLSHTPPLSVSPQLSSFSLLSPLLIVCLVRSGFA